MLDNREQMVNQVQALNGDQVKALVLGWLLGTEGKIDDFSELLEANIETTTLRFQEDVVHGDSDEDLSFLPLTEEEMIAQSLKVLEDYKRTGTGVPHERVQAWLG